MTLFFCDLNASVWQANHFLHIYDTGIFFRRDIPRPVVAEATHFSLETHSEGIKKPDRFF